MYDITRDEAANILNLSTRSVDRYIKSGKLRSKKEGKIVYIHMEDVNNFSANPNKKMQVIVNKTEKDFVESKEIKSSSDNSDILKIYESLKEEIKEKDKTIFELSSKIGKMEEVVKNSISLVEFKKSQFLLEESRGNLSKKLDDTKKELEKYEGKIKEERIMQYMLIGIIGVLLISILVVWFIKI